MKKKITLLLFCALCALLGLGTTLFVKTVSADTCGTYFGQLFTSYQADTLCRWIAAGKIPLIVTNGAITANTGNITASAGSFVAATSGATLHLQEASGASKCMGSVTFNGTTAVTVSTTCAATGARIFLSPTSDPTGATAAYCWATNIINGVSFDADCDQANDGTANWIIFKESPG